MANIILNGQSNIDNVICYSHAPTILNVQTRHQGTPTVWTITLNGNISNISTDFQIKVNEVTLHLGMTPQDAKGYFFYLSPSTTPTQIKMQLNTIVMALRRIPDVVAGYDVYMKEDNTIILKSKSYGNLSPLTIETNIPFFTIAKEEGISRSEFNEGYLNIDVYKQPVAKKIASVSDTTDLGDYITTFSKHVAGDYEVKYDLASIFSSLTNEGEISQFGLKIYHTNNTDFIDIATYTNVYNVNGYMVNQGGEFQGRFEQARIALNVSRGTNRNYLNNTVLYVYENTIPLSIYVTNSINTIKYKIHYVDSGNDDIINIEEEVNTTEALNHFTIALSDNYLYQSKYIDIEFEGGLGTLRFNVIKPARATDECQRVYWYNSYGGVSFMDFTGGSTSERKVKITTYEDSRLDYYDNDVNERDYIYDKTNEITVTLTTHQIVKDAQWYLFDLQQSRTAWTIVNGEKYRILVDDVEINTTDVTDIYTASVKYTYSLGINA